MITSIIQAVLTLACLAHAARVGWLGPRFERSLTGDSRLELFWRAGLLCIVLSLGSGRQPEDFQSSILSLLSLVTTLVLAAAYTQAYWWTDELTPKAKRVMETTCRLPEARRMIRCWIWTTTGFLLAAHTSKSASIIALVLGAVTIVVWGKFGRNLLNLAARTRKCGHTLWDSQEGEFEVFLSYRRLNANVVRRIAEGLAMRGVRVWFDEYLIRARDRGLVEQRLSSGIAAARKLVVFSNDSYAQSPWCCRHELQPFIERVGVQNIVPIGMPKESEFLRKYGALLSDCSWKDFARTELLDEEIAEVITHVCKVVPLGWEPDLGSSTSSAIVSGPSNRVEVQADGCVVSLDLAGFEYWHDVEPEVSQNKNDGVSAFYKCEHRGTFVAVEFSAGLTWGKKRSAITTDQQLSDTELIEEQRDFASSWLEQTGYRDIGIHTIVAFGFRHFAMSYWQTIVGAWARKYSVVVPHPKTGENFEVVATFTHWGTFAEFLAFGSTMDATICSLKLR